MKSGFFCFQKGNLVAFRSLIADALTVLGIHVEDIMSKTRSQLHSLTSFGRVRHGRITYPRNKSNRRLSSQVRIKEQ